MGWDGLALIGLERVMVGGEDAKSGWVVIGVKSGWVGFRRLCVVCATTGICCKCNSFIQIHAPG